MDRLTKTYEDGSHGVANNLPCGENSYDFKNLLIDVLGAYEDIGLTSEQLTEIDKLYAEKCREVAELRKQQRWIPVEEQLPKLDEDGYAYVMVCMDDEFIATTDYTRDEGFGLWADSGEVVAWMPLPEPYKAE